MSKRYFLHDGTAPYAVSASELRRLVAEGRLKPTDMVLPEGEKQWVAALRLKGLFPAAPAVAKPAPKPAPVVRAVPVARAIPVAKAVPVVRAVPVQPVVEEQPKSALDQVCGWLAAKVSEATGSEVTASQVKVAGGVALAAVAVAAVAPVTAEASAGGSASSSGMGRHEARATAEMMMIENTVNAGGTVTWKYG